MRYLDRYATSSGHLKMLLMQRVRRSCAHHGDAVSDGETLVDAEIGRLLRSGFLNDDEFAASRARLLHRRGKGQRAIRAGLQAKRLGSAEIDRALALLAEEVGDVEWAAVRTWARKKRLGPWAREKNEDPVRRRKDLARFGRAGFSYGIALRILDAEDELDA
jgi:regulatory protein